MHVQEQQVAQGLRRLVSELSEQLAFLQNANAVLQRRDAHREVQCERDLPQAEVRSPRQALLCTHAVVMGAQFCLTWSSLMANTLEVILVVTS